MGLPIPAKDVLQILMLLWPMFGGKKKRAAALELAPLVTLAVQQWEDGVAMALSRAVESEPELREFRRTLDRIYLTAKSLRD